MRGAATLLILPMLAPGCGAAEDPESFTVLETTAPDDWLGRWEDGTGYWLQISLADGVPGLQRSGSTRTDELELIDFLPAESILRYGESGYYPRDFENPAGPTDFGPLWIHTLEMVGAGVMRDVLEPVGAMDGSSMTKLLRHRR